MIFEIDIPDDAVRALEEFRQTQVTHYPDPDTASPRKKFEYEDVEELIARHVLGLAEQAMRTFPSDAMRERLKAEIAAKKAFSDSLRPKIRKVSV